MHTPRATAYANTTYTTPSPLARAAACHCRRPVTVSRTCPFGNDNNNKRCCCCGRLYESDILYYYHVRRDIDRARGRRGAARGASASIRRRSRPERVAVGHARHVSSSSRECDATAAAAAAELSVT